MRIVAGKFGGRKLEVPKGRDIRPTADKVRGAILNALHSQGAVKDARVLDPFCGTGALGLEALSRGAAHCTFMDKEKKSLATTKSNAESLGLGDEVDFILRDVSKITKSCDYPYDLVFLDPPYHKGLVNVALDIFLKKDWLAQGATIVLETEQNFSEALPACFTPISEKVYGDTKVMFLEYTGEE